MTDREFFEERAAIREFDGGMSRKEAEKAAALDVERYYAELRILNGVVIT